MKTIVTLPSLFLKFTEGKNTVEVEGETVGEALNNLVKIYYLMGKLLFSDNGRIKSTINIYIINKGINTPAEEETPLRENDSIRIIPTIAGGF